MSSNCIYDLIWFSFYLRINRLGWPHVGFNSHQFLTLANLATIKSYLFMSWWLMGFPDDNMHLHWLLVTIETFLLRILFNWSQPYGWTLICNLIPFNSLTFVQKTYFWSNVLMNISFSTAQELLHITCHWFMIRNLFSGL